MGTSPSDAQPDGNERNRERIFVFFNFSDGMQVKNLDCVYVKALVYELRTYDESNCDREFMPEKVFSSSTFKTLSLSPSALSLSRTACRLKSTVARALRLNVTSHRLSICTIDNLKFKESQNV